MAPPKFAYTALLSGILRNRSTAAMSLVVGSFLIANLWWDLHYRMSQPLDIDEAGYFAFPLLAFHSYVAGGIDGWFNQLQQPNQQPPVTTAITSLLCILFGPTLYCGFIAECLLGCVALIGAYFVGKELSGRRLGGVLTAILLGTVPVLVGEVRSYHFTVAATAATTWALLALFRSKHLTHTRWSIALGVFVGLMPLSRTVSVALIPGMLVDVVIVLLTTHSRRDSLKNLGLASLATICIAATWNIRSWQLVWDYLVGFGYGARSFEYGSSINPLLSASDWLQYIQRLAIDFYAIHMILTFLGFLALAFYAVRRVLSGKISTSPRLGDPLVLSLLFVIIAIVSLRSSRNVGSFFEAPLFPVMIAMGVAGWALLFTRYFTMIAALQTTLVVFLSISMMDLEAPQNGPLRSEIFQIPLILTQPGSHIQSYEGAGGYASSNLNLPISLADGKRWTIVIQEANRILVPPHSNAYPTAFGFNERLFNINSVNLPSVVEEGREGPFLLVDPFSIGDNKIAYQHWLTSGGGASTCHLLTAGGSVAMFLPSVTQEYIEAAARASGFVKEESVEFPNGGLLKVWRRDSNCK